MILKSFPDTATLDEVIKAAEMEAINQDVCIKYRSPYAYCIPSLRKVEIK